MTNARSATEALALLQLLARQAEPLPAASIASALDLPRSSTYHLLRVLREAGFVVHLEAERRWGLGVAAFELGSAYSRQAPLQRIARPVITRLVDQVRQSAHLVILHGRDVLYVIEERSVGKASLITDVGVRLPAPLTASGLAILAALPRAQVRALFGSRDDFVTRDGRGPASLAELREELRLVRARGFALEQGSVTAGLASVAGAVLDHTGHPVAGVAVTYRHEEIDETARGPLIQAVLRASGDLSRRLGHGGQPG